MPNVFIFLKIQEGLKAFTEVSLRASYEHAFLIGCYSLPSVLSLETSTDVEESCKTVERTKRL